MKKVYIICPVRGVTEEEKQSLLDYVVRLESEGARVYYPARDTNQNDSDGGINVMRANKVAIKSADEVHIFWNNASKGSTFDLGMTFMAGKPIRIINKDGIQRTKEKSFENVILELEKRI